MAKDKKKDKKNKGKIDPQAQLKKAKEQMSENQAQAEEKGKEKQEAKEKRSSQITIIFAALMAVIMMPTTLMLIIGMLPTPAAFIAPRSLRKAKVITVAVMNFAGCSPFVLELWSQGNTFDASLSIISQPMAIVVMYSAAGMGYMIDWAMTGLVSGFLYERGKKRIVKIDEERKKLIDRWGREVTGELRLDEHGFPLEAPSEDKVAKPPEPSEEDSLLPDELRD